jgi:predicted negative regulator of RcsB-dependent stress response
VTKPTQKLAPKKARTEGRSYRWVVVLFSVILLAIVVTSGALYYNNLQAEQRLEAFYLIEKDIQDQTIDVQQVEEFVNEYNGTKQAELLMYYTALYYFSEKKYQDAENWILQTEIEEQTTISTVSRLLLANIYQQQKKYEQANSVLESIDVPSMADYLSIEIIQNKVLAGKIGEARTLLDSFFKNYRGSDLKAAAEEILRLIS